MKSILVFDTETTGFANFGADHKSQSARLVQLAAILFAPTGKRIATFASIIQPVDFEIPSGASAVHGITTEFATAHGSPLSYALDWFHHMVVRHEPICVAHNFKFDQLILDSELFRVGYCVNSIFEGLDTYCTMLNSTDVCKIPGKYGKNKWPKCVEAYSLLCGKELVGAHGALEDCSATAEIYFELKRREQPEPLAEEQE